MPARARPDPLKLLRRRPLQQGAKMPLPDNVIIHEPKEDAPIMTAPPDQGYQAEQGY